MRLVWHLAKNDLRRLAWPAAAWLALVALPAWWAAGWAAGEAAVLAGTATRWLEVVAILAGGMTVMQVVAGLLLAGQLVVDDPVEGTNAHWLTRPIAGGRLLAAKVVAAALIFAAAPLAVLLPGWLAAGLGAGDCATLAVEWVLRAGGGMVAAMALAAVARDFSHFAISGLAWLVMLGIAMSRWPAQWIGREAAFNGSPQLLFGAVVVPLAAVALVEQYRTRRTGLGWVLLGAVVAATAAARLGWAVERGPAEAGARPTLEAPLKTGAEARVGAERLRVAGFTLPTPGAAQAAVVEERWRAEVLALEASSERRRAYFLRTGVKELRLTVASTGWAGQAGLMLRVSNLVREDGGGWPEGAVLVVRAE